SLPRAAARSRSHNLSRAIRRAGALAPRARWCRASTAPSSTGHGSPRKLPRRNLHSWGELLQALTPPRLAAVRSPRQTHHTTPPPPPHAGKRPRSTSIHPHVQESNMLLRERLLYYSASPIASKKIRRAPVRR